MSNKLIGIGLRHPHIEQFAAQKPNDIGWVEVHSENYLMCGGLAFDNLLEIRKSYPVSLHGIGMSLGSASGLDDVHLAQIKNLMDAVDPFMISDHLSWNTVSEKFLPDLLPTPFNDEALEVFTRNISIAQDTFKRQILLENPSTYFEFTESTYSEAEFLNLLSQKTGAGIVLDVNNIYISGLNNGWSAEQYIADINPGIVHEIHVSGHSVKKISDHESLYIDSHDSRVCDAVWLLYQQALSKFGKLPTLVEWDVNIPKLEILLQEAQKAESYINSFQEVIHA